MKFKTIKGKKIPLGAGIVLFKEENGKKILCLKIKNKNDIPKGIVEKNESDYSAAVRETFEEAGLKRSDYYLLCKKNSNQLIEIKTETITCYVGFIKKDVTPKICKNPVTLIKEHDSYKWLTKDEMINNCIQCIISIVNNSFDIITSADLEKKYVYI